MPQILFDSAGEIYTFNGQNRTFKPHTMLFKHHKCALRTYFFMSGHLKSRAQPNFAQSQLGIAKCGWMKMAECPPGVFARATSQSRSPSLLSSPTASGAMSIASVAEPRSTVQFLGNAPAKRQSISPIKAHDNSSKYNMILKYCGCSQYGSATTNNLQ